MSSYRIKKASAFGKIILGGLLIVYVLAVSIEFVSNIVERPPIHVLEFDNISTGLTPRVFYFGITHHSVHELAKAADNTWAKRVMPEGFPWYSDEFTSELKNLTVIKPPNGVSANRTYVYHRVMEVWKHVLKTVKGYDWYVQCWEDNYVIKERVEEIASKYNPNELIEIGRIHDDFIDGGSPHLMSRAVFEAYAKIVDKHPRRFNYGDFPYNNAEDMVQSYFKRKYIKIKYIKNNAAFNHCSLDWLGGRCTIPNYSKEDLTCRRKIIDNGVGSARVISETSPPDIPATFHYVTKEGQYLIDDLLYFTNCTS